MIIVPTSTGRRKRRRAIGGLKTALHAECRKANQRLRTPPRRQKHRVSF
ncbi:hypothetical protein J2857_002028 [Neorhizobium galegae]|nr:hypothetical protein [Neorhizobium galegae]